MQFGLSDVCDAAETNWANLGKCLPGSRSKDNARTANTGNCGNFAQRERGKGKGRERNANMANEERTMGGNDFDPERNERDDEFPVECWDVNFTANGANLQVILIGWKSKILERIAR